MNPKYVIRKSALPAITPLMLLLFWLIIPTIIMIARAVVLKHHYIELYDGYFIEKKGVLSKSERKVVYQGAYSISLEQSFLGRIFGYGNLYVDAIGHWDINLNGIKDPNGVKAHLENTLVKAGQVNSVVME